MDGDDNQNEVAHDDEDGEMSGTKGDEDKTENDINRAGYRVVEEEEKWGKWWRTTVET